MQEELIELQKETLASVNEYLGNLIPGMKTACEELSGEMKEDTWEYLRMVMDGFNWVIEAYNGTFDYINRDGVVFNNKELDNAILELGKVYQAKDAEKIASIIKSDILPFLEKLQEVTCNC